MNREQIINQYISVYEGHAMEKEELEIMLNGFADDIVNNLQPSLPSNLDEAAEEYIKEGKYLPESFVVRPAFKAGAKWQKSQMLKDAVEGRVFMSFAPGHNQMVMADVDLPTNTKVRIVILKEEGE